MNLILFDGPEWTTLQPLTLTRSVADIRIGILTLYERWELLLNSHLSIKTQKFLTAKYSLIEKEYNLFINSAFFPNDELIDKINSLCIGDAILQNNQIVAFYSNNINDSIKNRIYLQANLLHFIYPWDLFTNNKEALDFDFKLLTKNKISQEINKSNQVIGNVENIFLEQGAEVNCCFLNTNSGPIYIGKNAEVMEGSMIRGGLSLGENSKLNLGTKIYGSTSIGPNCKIGGEINNSIFFGYSNKAHDGFLGNSVIGQWCNLGANTNNSNLKNNYSNIKMWSIYENQFIETEHQFCGLIMGDHSKSAISTKFNTGTTVGVFANIFNNGFCDKYIPSFSWEGDSRQKFNLTKAFAIASKVMNRRNIELNEVDKEILKYISENF
ncbi:MAG: putative sugar nucleotidyl transferase [Solirubrobacteraceae bacterium]